METNQKPMAVYLSVPARADGSDWFSNSVARLLDRSPSDRGAAGMHRVHHVTYDSIDAVILSGAHARDNLARIAPRLEDALREASERAKGGPIESWELGLVHLIGALASTGATPPSGWLDTAKLMLQRAETSRTGAAYVFHWERGFAALALDVREVYRSVAGFGPNEPIAFTPGATFGPNVQGFLAHLAGAVSSRAPLEACMPAWKEFVMYSPALKSARGFTSALYLWAAWTLKHRIAGEPVDQVATWLSDQLHGFASEFVPRE